MTDEETVQDVEDEENPEDGKDEAQASKTRRVRRFVTRGSDLVEVTGPDPRIETR